MSTLKQVLFNVLSTFYLINFCLNLKVILTCHNKEEASKLNPDYTKVSASLLEKFPTAKVENPLLFTPNERGSTFAMIKHFLETVVQLTLVST